MSYSTETEQPAQAAADRAHTTEVACELSTFPNLSRVATSRLHAEPATHACRAAPALAGALTVEVAALASPGTTLLILLCTLLMLPDPASAMGLPSTNTCSRYCPARVDFTTRSPDANAPCRVAGPARENEYAPV